MSATSVTTGDATRDRDDLLTVLLEREAGRASATELASSSFLAQKMRDRLFAAGLQAAELMSVYIGVRLGLYEALAVGASTAGEIALRAGINARYAREWLEQQAVAAIVTVDHCDKPAEERLYSLSPGHAQALSLTTSPQTAALVLPMGALGAMLGKLLDVYRSGEGVPQVDYGTDMQRAHAGSFASYSRVLPTWIKAGIPGLDARLNSSGARLLDVGCGSGWSSITLARTYRHLQVDGIDLTGVSLDEARENATASGLADRVAFSSETGFTPDSARPYDLICIHMLHDVPRPVDLLRRCRAWRAPDGHVLVREMRVADTFTAPGTDMERFIYASSVLHCLCVGLAGSGAAGSGSAMRPSQLRRYAIEAGFADIERLSIEDRFNHLYRLLG